MVTPIEMKSVLVVDDDDDIRTNIQDILHDLGYHTDTAGNGEAAIELLQQRNYDVAILDYMMPGMDGASLQREIRRLRPETVSIMITAFAGSDGVQLAQEAGTWKILRKPVNVTELLPLVEEASNR